MTIDAVLEFWFGAGPDDAAIAKEKSALWWSKNPDIDAEMRQRFESLVHRAAAGELSDWQSNPRGWLALILLMDQFPRNIYRDSPRAFAHDPQALALCVDGIDRGVDLKLRPLERVFFYLPPEHAESLEQQDLSVRKFSALVSLVSAEQKPTFEEYLAYAMRHREIIARFGRFPHRNKILGRKPTSDELAFLATPGSSF
jgi:uncharacterized protein (DUF924 family)